jgi:Arm DNA-binding domain/Phage integrase, N-terminal SAM-like domain
VLVVYPNGIKSYALDYRAGWGRSAPKRRYTIGKHGSPWTPEAARTQAKKLLGKIEDGGDPAAQRQADRKIPTFSELIDTYLAEGCSHKKSTTLAADRGRIEHHLRPLLGKARIDQLSRADIERMRDAVTAGRTAETPEERRPGSLRGAERGQRRNASCWWAQSSGSPSSEGSEGTIRRMASRKRLSVKWSVFCRRRRSRSSRRCLKPMR